MSGKQHHYKIGLEWTGNNGVGTATYAAYDRNYTISAAHKPLLIGSSDSAFRGDNTKYNPEDMLVSSIASCHMLWYLHLCADEGIIVETYSGYAEGVMAETGQNGGHFVEVVLKPEITVSEDWMIDKAIALHEDAHRHCFIANSCNFPIRVEAQCSAAVKE